MLKFFLQLAVVTLLVTVIGSPAEGKIMGVMGPNSSLGAAPAIIAAPDHILDDSTVNRGQQGFDEAQGIVTTLDYMADGGRVIDKGTTVWSHMIFFNTEGHTFGSHECVVWTFEREIIAVMSDFNGTFEAASSGELGNPGTNYTMTFSGSGPAAPYRARGMERNDDYARIAPNKLKVKMRVSEPGDWIRVVTAGRKVPEPSSVLSLFGLSLVGLIGRRRLGRAS